MAKKDKDEKREELERTEDGEREGKARKKPDEDGKGDKPRRKGKKDDGKDKDDEGRKKWPFVVAGVLLVVIGVAAFMLLGGKEKKAPPKAYSGSNGAYTVKYPETWKPGEDGELARSDGAARVTIRDGASVPGDLDDFTRELEGELKDRYPDFRKRSANLVTVAAGQGYSYTFARTRARKEQTVVIVPAGESGYRIDGVSDTGAAPAAREMAEVIRSFALGPQ
jgi:hypothetical protein